MEKFKEGNLCWNCQFIAKCHTNRRPKTKCKSFSPLGIYVSQRHIGEWLGVSKMQLCYIISKFGAGKIVELLEDRGRRVRYEIITNYIKFYYMGEITENA